MIQVSQPSKLYLISDWSHWDTWGANNTSNFPGFFGGKYTFGFADGHIKSYTAGSLPVANPGITNYNGAFWSAFTP